MISAAKFAECALLPKWEKYTYDKLDCQAFVEAVLKEIGVRKPDGSVFDWRGSNSMFRNYYSWRGTVDECRDRFGCIPVGCFLYKWYPTGEQDRGYHDGQGNAKHVGIYCGQDIVRDSTRYKNASGSYVRNGPGTCSLKGWNRVTLFEYLDYSVTNSYNPSVETAMAVIDGIRNQLNELEGMLNDIFRN